MKQKRVAVFMGGVSAEHEISVRSGTQVLKALESERPLAVLIGKDRSFTVDEQRHTTIGAALDHLLAEADVAFLALHGPFGEDGTVQGLLEVLNLPYTGSAVAASALAMDKIRTKDLYRARGLPTSDSFVFAGALEPGRLAEVEHGLGFPVVVKPSKNGSSVGVSFPKDRVTLENEVRRLLHEGNEVLVERFIRGREFTCGVLESVEGGWIKALPVTEIIPDRKYEFFDYEAKYTPGATNEVTPADLPKPIFEEMQRLAVAAHRALGCRDFSRTDIMLDPARGPLLLETNTIPGLTQQSLLPQAAQVAGLPFPELVRLLVDNARRRHP